jgi:hypothetical protein
VKSIVAKFPSESAVLVHESQSTFNDPKVACSIAYIRSKCGWLPESIKRLETQGLPLQESMDMKKIENEKLSVVKRDAGESVSTMFQAVLKRNPGFLAFTSVCLVLNGDDVDSPEDIAPEKIPLLKYAQVSSCDAERYFSAYKHILPDKRQSVTHRKYGKDSNCILCIKKSMFVPKDCKQRLLAKGNIILCDVTYFNEYTYFTKYFKGFCYVIMYMFCMMILHKSPSSSNNALV